MIVVISGHRWNGVRDEPPGLRRRLAERLIELQTVELYTGMALGFDQLAALTALSLGIPYVACVPCDGQDATWSEPARERYSLLLRKAKAVVSVPGGPYEPWKMHARNRFMISQVEDKGGLVLAYFTGRPGGTQQCVREALARGVTVENLAEIDVLNDQRITMEEG
jgi:uncharacterized phage-like protein YoqJ